MSVKPSARLRASSFILKYTLRFMTAALALALAVVVVVAVVAAGW